MKCQSRSRPAGLALVPVLLLVLSACLPPSSEGLSPQPGSGARTAATSGQASPTAGDPTAAQPAGPAGPAAPQADAPVVRWIPIGPVGPNDPTSGQRYLLLQQFQCDALDRSIEGAEDAAVWVAGAAVCRAVLSGSRGTGKGRPTRFRPCRGFHRVSAWSSGLQPCRPLWWPNVAVTLMLPSRWNRGWARHVRASCWA